MKKLILSVLVAVLAVGSLTACSGNSEKAKNDEAMKKFLGTESSQSK